jgi:hypothetical protein
MTGKELVFVLGGAVAFGGAAGAAGSAIAGGAASAPPIAAPVADAGVEKRLEALEERLRAAMARNDELAASLEAARAALDASASRFALPPGTPGMSTGLLVPHVEDGRPLIPIVFDGAGEGQHAKLLDALLQAKPVDRDAGALEAQFHSMKEEATKAVAEQLRGVAAGLGLRALPEAERWARAKEELGLSDAQVESLKASAAERERAMEAAYVTQTSEEDGKGGSFTIKSLDPELARKADADWTAARDAVLGAEQRKDWTAKGWDHAMGSAGSPWRIGAPRAAAMIEIKAETVLPDGDAPK